MRMQFFFCNDNCGPRRPIIYPFWPPTHPAGCAAWATVSTDCYLGRGPALMVQRPGSPGEAPAAGTALALFKTRFPSGETMADPLRRAALRAVHLQLLGRCLLANANEHAQPYRIFHGRQQGARRFHNTSQRSAPRDGRKLAKVSLSVTDGRGAWAIGFWMVIR